MSYKLLSNCPVCSSKMKVMELSCDTCGTVVKSEFSFSKFESLSEEQLNFAEVFIKNRGNIKDVEKELGISYPTVRAKLNDVIKSLGYAVKGGSGKDNTVTDIIDKLERGEISPDDAINKIKE